MVAKIKITVFFLSHLCTPVFPKDRSANHLWTFKILQLIREIFFGGVKNMLYVFD